MVMSLSFFLSSVLLLTRDRAVKHRMALAQGALLHEKTVVDDLESAQFSLLLSSVIVAWDGILNAFDLGVFRAVHDIKGKQC